MVGEAELDGRNPFFAPRATKDWEHAKGTQKGGAHSWQPGASLQP
jgi:hypothetical protein